MLQGNVNYCKLLPGGTEAKTTCNVGQGTPRSCKVLKGATSGCKVLQRAKGRYTVL